MTCFKMIRLAVLKIENTKFIYNPILHYNIQRLTWSVKTMLIGYAILMEDGDTACIYENWQFEKIVNRKLNSLERQYIIFIF